MVPGADQDGRSDQELLRAALEDRDSLGARKAASDLLARYQQRVYGWCIQHVRDHERALELAQEVLLSAYRNLDSFGGRAQFSSWMFSIVRNRCISEMRRPRLLADEDCDPETLRSNSPSPAEMLVEKLDEEALLNLIKTCLTPQEQEVLWLRCIRRMPLDTINRALDIQQASGARGVLQSARRKLKAVLEAERGLDVEIGP
jgi:RNA polymerase sigma factor (sigma-70 family)